MKSNILPDVWPAHPLLSTRNLRSAPTSALLAEILGLSVGNVDHQCWLHWALDSNTDSSLSLGVVTHGHVDRINWNDSKSKGSGESEWKLYREGYGRKVELWSLRTGDMTLLKSLLDSEGSKFNKPDSSATASAAAPAVSSIGAPFVGEQGKNSLQNAVWNRLGISADVAAPPPPSPASAAGLMLAGNVKEVDITNIMQSINLCQMTGRLSVAQMQRQVEIFFDEGELVHARSLQTLHAGEIIIGEEAVLDLFTWGEGAFQFQHLWKSSDKTIDRKLHSILLEGATLQDYQASLRAKNITLTSTLVDNPAYVQLSEADFDIVLKKGIPSHQVLQKQLFLKLRKPQLLESLISELQLTGPIWIPLIYNLVNLDLLILVS